MVQKLKVSIMKTFSPIVKLISIQIILYVALVSGWVIRQLDVKNVFLNSILKKTIYMEQATSFINAKYP